MGYTAVVLIAATAHLVFIGYVVVGGFLAWRFPRTLWLHAAAVTWAVINAVVGVDCPLTDVDRWARDRSEISALSADGFIDHYLTGVVYPDDAAVTMRNVVFAVVVASWIGFAVLRLRRRRAPDRPPARRRRADPV